MNGPRTCGGHFLYYLGDMKEHLNECFHYDPDAGSLTWKSRPRSHFNSDRGWRCFTTRCAGKSATTRHSAGYLQITRPMNGSSSLAHRVIWTMVHGDIPPGMQVDHINGDRADNRLCNLRLATCSQNQHNRSKSTKSVYKGVGYDKRRGVWYSRIQSFGVVYHLGMFRNPEDAHAAYCKAARHVHGEFAKFD